MAALHKLTASASLPALKATSAAERWDDIADLSGRERDVRSESKAMDGSSEVSVALADHRLSSPMETGRVYSPESRLNSTW
jgi:hypothetical protein